MSRSGTKYRDPFNIDARKRKAGPMGKSRRAKLEELEAEEREDEIEGWMTLHDPQEWIQRELEDDEDSLVQ